MSYLRQGLVAQWTRARGYEPRSRGFKSLLAHCHQQVVESLPPVFCLLFKPYLDLTFSAMGFCSVD